MALQRLHGALSAEGLGIPMGLTWVYPEKSQDCVGCSRDFHGIHEIFMGFQWDFNGISRGLNGIFSGIFMG